jgi:hypothetical protein
MSLETNIIRKLQSRNHPNRTILEVVFNSYDDLVQKFLALRDQDIAVHEFYLMVHGLAVNADLLICGTQTTTYRTMVDAHRFFYAGQHVPAFPRRWIYCGSFHNPAMLPDNNYVRTFGETFNRAGCVTFWYGGVQYAVTLNVRFTNLDTIVHSGLNPEVLLLPNVVARELGVLRGQFIGATGFAVYY